VSARGLPPLPPLVVIVTVLVALGYFDKFRGPRIHITFEPSEPWCRYGPLKADWSRCGLASGSRVEARHRRAAASGA
jgi:hypothetical protein